MNQKFGDRLRDLADRADTAGESLSDKASDVIERLIAKLQDALAKIEAGEEPEAEADEPTAGQLPA